MRIVYNYDMQLVAIVDVKLRYTKNIFQWMHGGDEHRTGLGLDWIRTLANFVEFGSDPDCKSLQNFGTGPDLD